MQTRNVKQIISAQAVSDGAGVKINRIKVDPAVLDPYIMIDEINSDDRADFVAGFPPHPHRGFETITYMREGAFKHRDSLGNEGRIEAGGVQWMTAGRGLIHSEMPEPHHNRIHGFQIWLNLPAADKMMTPAYRDIEPNESPLETANGTSIRVIGGTLARNGASVTGPIGERGTAPHLFDAELEAGATFEAVLGRALNAIVYVYRGSIGIGTESVAERHAAILDGGDRLELQALESCGLLILAGRPLQEPVAQAGPFVMNTRVELEQAFEDYRAGRFQAEPTLST